MKIAALATIALLAVTGTASAQTARQRAIDQTQAAQERDIAAHRYSGDLTRREQAALQAEQAAIARREAEARRDGVVTRREAAEIRDAQARAGRHIAQESSDGETSAWRRFWSRKGF